MDIKFSIGEIMKKESDVCVLVQSRLSSTRVPKKMILFFVEITLVDILLEKLTECSIPNSNIYFSAYENELKNKCEKYPINFFQRSKESSESEGQDLTVLFEWWNKIPFKYIVMVSACCPLLKKETIERFYQDYLGSESDAMFGVIEKRNYFWDEDGNYLLESKKEALNTKTAKKVKEAAHCLYAAPMEKIGKNIWMGDLQKKGEVELWTLNEDEVFDIDYPWQFDYCEAIYKNRRNK
jgi:CMP-N-acetylneuraminic acid synthetase